MEEKYADNHCGSEIQHGCWGTVTLLSETAAVFPKYKKLEQYIPIAFSKRGRHQVEAVQVLDNSDWFYMASVTPSNNSAVKIEVADAENLLREEVIVGTYQSSYRRVVPRKARISGFAKLTGGPEFISLNMKKEEGDIGAPVVTENGEYIGMIVKSPFGGDTKGVRYALPASTIIASVRNSFWYQEQ
jgi:hypothetical protein